MARFCSQCGNEIQSGSKFCIKCGKKVENDLDDIRTGQSVSSPAVQNKTTGNNNKLVVPLIVTLLVIGGIGGYFVFGRSSDNKKDAVQSQPNPTQQAQQITKPAKNAPTSKEAPKEEKTGFIVGVNVNAREKASIDSAVVGTFTLGEKVVILTDEPEWAKVKRADGQECYVFKKFLGDQAALDKRQAKYAGFTIISRGGITPSISRAPENSIRKGPTYNENGTSFRFSAIYSSKLGETISFDKESKSEWKAVNLGINEPMGGHDTMQIKDNASGKIFYAVSSNCVNHAYLLGYDFEKNKAILYVNSDDFYVPFREQTAKAKGWYTGAVEFVLRDSSLYLVFVPFSSQIPSTGEFKPVAYRLFWDSKANKFGYEDIGQFNR